MSKTASLAVLTFGLLPVFAQQSDNPVVRGMINGVILGQQMQRGRATNDANRREQERHDREMQELDLRIKTLQLQLAETSPPNIPSQTQPAASRPPVTTGGLVNGNGWIVMSDDFRVGYILGSRDIGSTGREDLKIDGAISGRQIINEISTFYLDSPANLRIPLVAAWRYVAAKHKGTTPEDLETMVAGLRRFIADTGE